MRHVLCFGDSNTWGTQPMAHADDVRRLPHDQRWPGVMQAALGTTWRVIEEGLPGRTLHLDDPIEGQDRNALRMIRGLLESHRPLDWILVMLGTNDCKARFGETPTGAMAGLHAMVDAIEACALPGLPAPRVLLVAPAPLRERGWLAPRFLGGEALADALAECVTTVARQRGVHAFHAGTVASVDAVDGIHLDAPSHLRLGQALARWLQEAEASRAPQTFSDV